MTRTQCPRRRVTFGARLASQSNHAAVFARTPQDSYRALHMQSLPHSLFSRSDGRVIISPSSSPYMMPQGLRRQLIHCTHLLPIVSRLSGRRSVDIGGLLLLLHPRSYCELRKVIPGSQALAYSRHHPVSSCRAERLIFPSRSTTSTPSPRTNDIHITYPLTGFVRFDFALYSQARYCIIIP